jgi:hypothetical protein
MDADCWASLTLTPTYVAMSLMVWVLWAWVMVAIRGGPQQHRD